MNNKPPCAECPYRKGTLFYSRNGTNDGVCHMTWHKANRAKCRGKKLHDETGEFFASKKYSGSDARDTRFECRLEAPERVA